MSITRSKILYKNYSPALNDFYAFVGNISSTLISGATDHGRCYVNIIHSGSTVYTFGPNNLTSTPSQIICYFSGSPSQHIDKIEIYVEVSGLTGVQKVQVDFSDDGGITILKHLLVTITSLFWVGYVQPDNLTRDFVNPGYFIEINATDGLADLKNIDFPITGTTKEIRLIKYIRDALAQTNLNLPILSQVNITETNNLSSLVLDILTANSDRFRKVEDNGNVTLTTCYDVLSQILDVLNAEVFQENGSWYLVTKNEINSKLTTWTSGLTFSTAAYNRSLNIDDFQHYKVITGSDTLSKVRPLKQVGVTLLNENLGSSFIDGSTSYANGTAPNASGSFSNSSGTIHTLSQSGTGPSPDYANTQTYFRTPTTGYAFTMVGTGNTVNFSLDVNTDYATTAPIGSSGDRPPKLKVELVKTSGIVYYASTQPLVRGSRHIDYSFPLTGSTTYYVRIWIMPDYPATSYTRIACTYTNLGLSIHYPDTVTFDTYYIGGNSGTNAIAVQNDFQIYFGDVQLTDIANLQYGVTPTSKWKNYGSTTGDSFNVSLQMLYAYNKLALRQEFKNYIALSLKNYLPIDYNNVLIQNGKYYKILSYKNDLANNFVDCELVEIPQSAIGIYFASTTLTSINGSTNSGSAGASIAGGTTIISGGGVTTSAFLNYTNVTAPATYINKTVFNSYTGTTNGRLTTIETNYVTGATNLSGGLPLYTSVNAHKLQLKSLKAGTNITLTPTSSGITINSISSGTITGATNGLSVTGAKIKLGGLLTGNTTISGASTLLLYQQKVNGSTSLNSKIEQSFPSNQYSKTRIQAENSSSFGIDNSLAFVEAQTFTGGTSLLSYARMFFQNNSNQSELNLNRNGLLLTFPTGTTSIFNYATNYSSRFTPRSLVDKGFVTGLTTTSGIQTANNGLTKSGTNIHLGGALTGNTDIDGTFSAYNLRLGGTGTFSQPNPIGNLFVNAMTNIELTANNFYLNGFFELANAGGSLKLSSSYLEVNSTNLVCDTFQFTFKGDGTQPVSFGTTDFFSVENYVQSLSVMATDIAQITVNPSNYGAKFGSQFTMQNNIAGIIINDSTGYTSVNVMNVRRANSLTHGEMGWSNLTANSQDGNKAVSLVLGLTGNNFEDNYGLIYDGSDSANLELTNIRLSFADKRSGANQKGLEYNADYSTNYSNRSLVDRGYILGAKTYTAQQTFAAATTTKAPLRILGGTTPTGATLQDGIIWIANNHLYVRLSGTTKQII